MRTLSTATILLTVLFILSKCATTNTERSERSQDVISTLETVEEQLNRLTTQLNQTSESLRNISNTEESNLEEEFSSFRSNLSTLSDVRDEFDSTIEDIRSSTNQYLAEWQDETYDNEQLRNSSQDRRQELSEAFSEVLDHGGEVNRRLQDYISSANEIESYLSNDLSISGANAVSESRRTVMDYGDELRETIDNMEQSIAHAKREMGTETTTGESEDQQF